MKKLLKILAIVVAIPVTLFAVAAVVLVTIDLNDYREDIAAAVSEQTGRQLTVKGDLGKSFFPWLGIKIGDVALSNAKGFGEKPFAAVKRVEVKIDTLSLLKMQPAIDQVILHGLEMNLAKNKQGVSNWEDLTAAANKSADEVAEKPGATEKVDPKAADPNAPASDPMEVIAAITVGGIDIRDASVSWEDAQANVRYDVNNFNLSISKIAFQEPLSLSLAFDFVSKEPQLKSHIELASKQIEWNLEKQLYQLKPFSLKVDAQGAAVGPHPVSLNLETDIKADLAEELLSVSALRIQTMGLKVNGDAQVTKLMSTPKFTAGLAIPAFNLRDLLAKLKIALPPMADPKALTHVALNLDVNGDTNNLNVEMLKVKLDNTNLKTEASVKNFTRPAINFDVNIDSINVDNYLPPKAESTDDKQAAPPPTASANEPEQPLPVPVEMLRTLDVDGALKIKQLTVMQLTSNDVTIGVKAKRGRIDVKPLSLNVAQGSISSHVSLDVTKDTPVYAVKNTSIKSVQAAPLAKAVMGDDMVSGVLDLSADVNTQGLMVSEIKKQLNGDVKFRFANGAVKGFNLGEIIRKGMATIKQEEYKPQDAPLTTDFAELSGSANITNGVVTNKDLSAKSPLLRVAGDGKVDLTHDYINYLATSYAVATSKGQEGKDVDDLKGLPIPIRVKGTFADLKYDIDYGPMRKALKDRAKKKIAAKKEEIKQEARQEVKKEVEEQKAKAKKKAEDKLKDKLKKLF